MPFEKCGDGNHANRKEQTLLPAPGMTARGQFGPCAKIRNSRLNWPDPGIMFPIVVLPWCSLFVVALSSFVCLVFRVRRVSFLELELELIQYQMTQKPMLRCEVGARSLRASSHA